MDNIDKNVKSSATQEVLAESVRRQYLDAMGIQTWFDPEIKLPQVRISSQVIVEESVSEVNVIIESGVPDVQQSANEVDVQPPQTVSPVSHQPAEKTQVVAVPTQAIAEAQVNHSIDDIESLSVKIEQCQLCELHTLRKQAICGEGNVSARLLLLIDAPINDAEGENALFSSEDKQMLLAMLKTIGITLSSVYLSSLVKCQPAQQRAPYTSEMICCDDHLTAQIKLIQPDAIMVLGEQASQQLLVSQKSLTDLRLRHHKHLGVPVYASYHPRELFNSSDTKRKVWADLLQIRQHIT